jgi:tetratricopeptide (TPR) repeat protein
MLSRSILVLLVSLSAAAVGCGWGSTGGDSNTNANAPDPNARVEYSDAETALAEGNRFFDENQTEKAIDAYAQAVKMNPDLAEAYFKLGVAYLVIEGEQELIVTPADGSDSPGPAKKTSQRNSTVAFNNAVAAYKKMIDADSKNDVAFFNLGRVYNRLNEDKESRKALETAVKLKPDDSQYQTELGTILIKLAQYDEAVRALKKALEIDDANAQAAELLEQAQAGKKRVDFGAEKLKEQMTAGQRSSSSNSSDNASNSDPGDMPADKKPETDKKPEPKKPEPPKSKPAAKPA